MTRLMQFIRDGAWQFVFGAIGIALTVVFFWYQQSYKELDYEIISLAPLFNISEEARGNIQVLFNGKPADNTYLAIVKIYNSGTIPILRTDYDTPISVVFNEDVNIISAEVLRTDDSSITTTIRLTKNIVTLDPILINPKESITVKVLADKYKGDISLSHRIIGVKKIPLRNPLEELRTSLTFLLFIGGTLMFIPMVTIVSIAIWNGGYIDERFIVNRVLLYLLTIGLIIMIVCGVLFARYIPSTFRR